MAKAVLVRNGSTADHRYVTRYGVADEHETASIKIDEFLWLAGRERALKKGAGYRIRSHQVEFSFRPFERYPTAPTRRAAEKYTRTWQITVRSILRLVARVDNAGSGTTGARKAAGLAVRTQARQFLQCPFSRRAQFPAPATFPATTTFPASLPHPPLFGLGSSARPSVG